MQTLDLRSNGQMSISQARLITELEPQVRDEYNNFIANIIKKNNVVGLTWLTRVTCRNTFISSIHDSFCRLALFEELCEKGEFYTTVLVDSTVLAKLLHKISDRYKCSINIKVTSSKFKNYPITAINFVKACSVVLNSYFWPRVVRNKKLPPNTDIILVDNFVLLESFNAKAELKDRYFPGLLDWVDDTLKEKIWYSLILIGLKTPWQYFKIFKLIRASKTQIILKEDWLCMRDYISAFYLSYRLPNNISMIPLWREYDVSEIVSEESRKDIFSTEILNSILIYKYIERLSKNSIKLSMVIDWFENQVIDRALHLAVNNFYPNVYKKGYQGFIIDDYFACQQPTELELLGNTIPNEICVVGKVYVNHRKALCSQLNVQVAPALRATHVYQVKNRHPDDATILLVLPLSLVGARSIINMCLEVDDLQGMKYIVKQHPDYSITRFRGLIPEVNDERFIFTEKNILELFETATLLLSNASSVCLEAICAGVPLVIAGSRCGPTMNPVKSFVDKELYDCCFDGDCLSNSIRAITSNKIRNKISVEDYFEVVDCAGVTKFLTHNDQSNP